MSVWFTSDTHYHHAGIIEYSHRPYTDVNEMNSAMIDNWNSVVKPGDLVYHLGDFSFAKPEESNKIAKRLMGQKYLIFGNHDKRMRKDPDFMKHWIWAKDLAEISVGDQRITLCHFAMETWNKSHGGAWSLHGHSHGSLKENPNRLRLDVGVDCWDYYPVNYDEIKKAMSKKVFEPVDHHGARDFEKT